MKNLVLRFGLALPVIVSGVALAAGHRLKTGSEVFTEPSGSKGSGSVDLLTAPDFFGVQALKLWEFDRRTCQLQIEQASLNVPGSGVRDPLKLCEPKLDQSWKRADVGQGQFVTAVAVCTPRSKDPALPLPVRGVEISGASIGASGKLVPAKRPVRIDFSGCDKWSPKSACPAGSIATGIRAFTEGELGAVGLGLRCHRIETSP